LLLSRLQKTDFFLKGLTLKYVKAPTITSEIRDRMANKTLMIIEDIYVAELIFVRLLIVKWVVGTIVTMEMKIKRLRAFVRELFMKLLLKWIMYRTISSKLITMIMILKISSGIEVVSDK
jgi:hypothetical protein